MPASLVHFTFIKENIDNKDPYFKETALGGQGPDVFFFYGYSFSKRENVKLVRDFGTYLHHVDISEAYAKLIEYALKSEHKEMLLAYIRGVFMHYILDRNLHPYIFYRSGYVTDGTKEDAHRFMVAHQYFESGLDNLYSKLHKTLQNPQKCVKIPNPSLVEISKMWYYLSKEINYEGIKEDTFVDCYSDMYFAFGFLNSPLKIKKFFFHIFKRNTSIDALAFPFTTKQAVKEDFLNIQKNEWKDCVSGESRFESLDELVTTAQKECEKINVFFEKPKLSSIKSFVNNIDHDGFKVNSEKKYFLH